MLNQLSQHGGLLDPEFENIYKWYNKYPLTQVTSVTATGALKVTEAGLLLGDTSDGAITSTLPTADGNMGLTYVIKLIDNTNAWTIARAGTDLIDGATSLVLTQLYRSVVIRSDDSDWVVISGLDSNPPGLIVPFGGALATAPAGYLACDGSSLLRADYPALYAAIGTAWGTADGTHFNVPDLRGKFPRGVDHGAANDPDRATRTAQAAGGNTGDAVGSVQDHQFNEHTHIQDQHLHGPGGGATYFYCYKAGGGYQSLAGGTNAIVTTVTNYTTATNQNSGGNETRPLNANVEWIIRY